MTCSYAGCTSPATETLEATAPETNSLKADMSDKNKPDGWIICDFEPWRGHVRAKLSNGELFLEDQRTGSFAPVAPELQVVWKGHFLEKLLEHGKISASEHRDFLRDSVARRLGVLGLGSGLPPEDEEDAAE